MSPDSKRLKIKLACTNLTSKEPTLIMDLTIGELSDEAVKSLQSSFVAAYGPNARKNTHHVALTAGEISLRADNMGSLAMKLRAKAFVEALLAKINSDIEAECPAAVVVSPMQALAEFCDESCEYMECEATPLSEVNATTTEPTPADTQDAPTESESVPTAEGNIGCKHSGCPHAAGKTT